MKTIRFLILLLFPSLTVAQTTIRHVNLIDVKAGKVLSDYAVTIQNELITWVGPDKKVAVIGSTLDGSGKYLIPGLIDTHIHFFQSGGIYTRPDVIDLRAKVPYQQEREFALNNAGDYLNRYLRLGITTVMDVGGPFMNFTVRDSIGKSMVAPNILVTGPLFSIVDRPQMALNDPPIVKVTTNKTIDSLFNKMLRYKPDFIKIWYIAGKQYPAEKSFPLVKYIGELSARHNLKLAVHATQLKTAQLAVEAGATILVHSIDDEVIPDAFVKVLREKKVTYIPTLIVSGNYYKVFSGTLPNHVQDLTWANAFAYRSTTDLESMDESAWPQAVRTIRKSNKPRSNAADSISAINLVKLVKAGVNVATGTDAGNIGTFHASSYLQELEAMQKDGMSNAEILKASTIHAAAGFGRDAQLGSIEKGKMADLVLLTKNPLESVQNLNAIHLILKSGHPLNPDSLVKESPEAVVQRQVNAYNARNIEAFLATYADDIELVGLDGKSFAKGHEAMRKIYEPFFRDTPNLYCEIENRMVFGNKVVDKEKVRVNQGAIHGIGIYEVTKGKIKRVTFLQ